MSQGVPATMPDSKSPRPFSLSGPHWSVSSVQLVDPSVGQLLWVLMAVFRFPFTGSVRKAKVSGSELDPSGSMRIPPVPFWPGPR